MPVISRHPAMPPAAVAVFARTPTPAEVKTRLLSLLGPWGVAGLQAALFYDTVRKVASLGPRVSRYLFLTGTGIPSFVASPRSQKKPRGTIIWQQGTLGRTPLTEVLPSVFFRSEFRAVAQRGADLGPRLDHAFRQLLALHARVVAIGVDSPALSPTTLRRALRELRFCEAVLGPCPDGGYYLIGLRRLGPGLFQGIRWGSKFALRDTLRNLMERGYSCSLLQALDDIDRPQDLERFARRLLPNPMVRERRQAYALTRFLKLWRARRSSEAREGKRHSSLKLVR